jgi:localization factor PodJL
MPDFGPVGGAAPQPAPDFSAGAAAASVGDDFIAAARRAAQAAATRPSVLHPELKAGAKPDAAPAAKKGFSLPFMKAKEEFKPVTYVNGQPVAETRGTSANDNKRKKLVLAGIVLLAAVSAFAFNMLAKPKGIKQTTSIEAPVNVAPAANSAPNAPAKPQGLPDAGTIGKQSLNTNDGSSVDMLATGSLPAKKTDATLSSIVAEPGAARAEMPPPEAGPQALREAAARGDAKAQFIIASRYLDGQSVAQDLPKAAYWYQQAASRGLAPAQYRLATLFERGKGVPQDVATALLWYERAAEGGNLKAMHNAAVIAAGNQAGTPNYDKAFKWFLAAAEQGLQDSQFNLAVLFERGLGTAVDKQEAFFWYTLAAKQGDSDAAKRAETLAKAMSGTEAAAASQRVASWSPIPSPEDANVVAVADPSWNDQQPAAAAPAPGIMNTDAAVPMMMSAPEPAPTASPVAQAQELLTQLGYNVGTPDGKMGGRTSNAIRLFQLQSGLKVTGEVTPELLDVMREKAG